MNYNQQSFIPKPNEKFRVEKLTRHNVEDLKFVNRAVLPGSLSGICYSLLLMHLSWCASSCVMNRSINVHVPLHRSFSVQYNSVKIYQQMITSGGRVSCVVYNQKKQPVGAMGCRVEQINDATQVMPTSVTQVKVYVMTLAVLASYRRMGLGRLMMDYLVSGAQRIESDTVHVQGIYLHVQSNNEDAISFYLKSGFVKERFIEEYYKRVEPKSCYILSLSFPDHPPQQQQHASNNESQQITSLL